MIEQSSSLQGAGLKSLLRQAVEGLIALDYGEAQLMFEPLSKKRAHYGTMPYSIRKLRMQALGYADLLIKNKYKGEGTVISTVANTYGIEADAFRGWRKSKRLGQTTDLWMQSFRKEIADRDWQQAKVLDDLCEAASFYKKLFMVAHQSKKPPNK